MFVSLLLLFSSSQESSSCEPTYNDTVLTASNGCKEVHVKSDCTSIGEEAFALSDIEIIDCSTATNLETIEYRAFLNCSKLKTVNLPESLTTIGSLAFSGCISLKSITIPRLVTFIGCSAFRNCSSLNEINIQSEITEFSSFIFSQCTSLTQYTVPDTVTKIHTFAFNDCSCLQRVILPANLQMIGDYAFSGTRIRKLKIPESVKNIGQYAFASCPWLENLTLPSSLRILPSGIFAQTSRLYNVDLPKRLVKIEHNAFKKSAIRTLKIPDSVTSIGDYAINSCSNLQTLILPKKFPNFGRNVFQFTENICHLNISSYNSDQDFQIRTMLTSRPFEPTCLTPLPELPKASPDNYAILSVEEVLASINSSPSSGNEDTPEDPISPGGGSSTGGSSGSESSDKDSPGGGSSGGDSPNQNPKDEKTKPSNGGTGANIKGENGNGSDNKKAGIVAGAVVGIIVVVVGITAGVYFLKKSKVYSADSDEYSPEIKSDP